MVQLFFSSFIIVFEPNSIEILEHIFHCMENDYVKKEVTKEMHEEKTLNVEVDGYFFTIIYIAENNNNNQENTHITHKRQENSVRSCKMKR